MKKLNTPCKIRDTENEIYTEQSAAEDGVSEYKSIETLLIQRLHYDPCGPGRPVCSKRSKLVDWCRIILLYISLFTSSITSCQVFLRCITISVTSRGSDKPMRRGGAKVRYGYPRFITIISTFYYDLLRSSAVRCVWTKA